MAESAIGAGDKVAEDVTVASGGDGEEPWLALDVSNVPNPWGVSERTLKKKTWQEQQRLKTQSSDRAVLRWDSEAINRAFAGDVAVIRQLVASRGALFYTNYVHNGETMLMSAIRHKHQAAIDELLQYPKIEVNFVGNGVCALSLAAAANDVELVRRLLTIPGIDVNLKVDHQLPSTEAGGLWMNWKKSPLMVAVLLKHEAVCDLLLEEPRTNLEFALTMALTNKDPVMVKKVLQHHNVPISELIHCAPAERDFLRPLLLEVLGIDATEWDKAARRPNDFLQLTHMYKTRLQWSPEDHFLFSPSVQKAVHTIMLLSRFTDCYLSAMPNEILFLIFGWITTAQWSHLRSIVNN